jgi:hypothetical protein
MGMDISQLQQQQQQQPQQPQQQQDAQPPYSLDSTWSEPPELIATFEEVIENILVLMNNTAKEQGMNLDVQTKALQGLASAVKTLVEAQIPEVDPQAKLDLQYQQMHNDNQLAVDQQQHQQAMDLQKHQMDVQKHQQDLQHAAELHGQSLQHNELQQALKEYQAQAQVQQGAQQHQQSLVHNEQSQQQNMAQQEQQMQLAEQQAQQQNQPQEKSN